MKIEMIVEKTKTGYSAYATKHSIFTAGKDFEELRNNMLDALTLHFHRQQKTFTTDNLKITLDLPQFFEYYKVINAKALSERIGMNQSLLAQYIKGIKKPSVIQTKKILKGVHEIGKELSTINFL